MHRNFSLLLIVLSLPAAAIMFGIRTNFGHAVMENDSYAWAYGSMDIFGGVSPETQRFTMYATGSVCLLCGAYGYAVHHMRYTAHATTWLNELLHSGKHSFSQHYAHRFDSAALLFNIQN